MNQLHYNQEKSPKRTPANAARKAFWDAALGDNSKLANLAKAAITEAEQQAKVREWVGLTDEERDTIYHNNEPYADLRAVETLLREKNAKQPAADDKAGGEAAACSCAECGKTSTKDAMWALYCLDCIQEHGLGASNSLRPGYERLIDEYIENYEFTDGDAGHHEPSDFELAMIKDAFMGFDFSTLYTHPQPQAEVLVPDAMTPDRAHKDAPKGYSYTEAGAWMVGWNACRDAMLAAAQKQQETDQ